MACCATPVSPPTRVLLTNDDGPASPFFDAFATALATTLAWPLFICPPADGQSFTSKSLGRGPVTLDRIHAHRVHVSGTPATAVNLALHALAPTCDYVISGPNIGHNAGRGSILSSGTVGAALEAAVAGRRAVALSFPFCNGYNNWTPAEMERAVEASVTLVASLWAEWEVGVDVYNVNVPLDFDRKEREGGGGDATTATLPPLRVVTTTVDPGAQYTSLYRESVWRVGGGCFGGRRGWRLGLLVVFSVESHAHTATFFFPLPLSPRPCRPVRPPRLRVRAVRPARVRSRQPSPRGRRGRRGGRVGQRVEAARRAAVGRVMRKGKPSALFTDTHCSFL